MRQGSRMSPEAGQLDPIVPVTLPLGRPYLNRRPSPGRSPCPPPVCRFDDPRVLDARPSRRRAVGMHGRYPGVQLRPALAVIVVPMRPDPMMLRLEP